MGDIIGETRSCYKFYCSCCVCSEVNLWICFFFFFRLTLQGLYQLYDIFKGIFLLNKNALFDAMFAEDAILDVVGILEYEPGCPAGQRRRHRDYLRQVGLSRPLAAGSPRGYSGRVTVRRPQRESQSFQ